MDMSTLIGGTPMENLLAAVHPDVFDQIPDVVSMRDLQRDMAAVLRRIREQKRYGVLTNRGAPSFLIIPFSSTSWMSLLVSAAPESEHEREKAHKLEDDGRELPTTRAVLKAAKATSAASM